MKGLYNAYSCFIHWNMKAMKGYEGFTPYVSPVELIHASVSKRRNIYLWGQHKQKPFMPLHNLHIPVYEGVSGAFINPSFCGSRVGACNGKHSPAAPQRATKPIQERATNE